MNLKIKETSRDFAVETYYFIFLAFNNVVVCCQFSKVFKKALKIIENYSKRQEAPFKVFWLDLLIKSEMFLKETLIVCLRTFQNDFYLLSDLLQGTWTAKVVTFQ